MQDLRVTLVQSSTVWEDVPANLSQIERALHKVQADLVVLPEMFATGFSMQSDRIAEAMDGATAAWMRTLARDLGSAIAGSAPIRTQAGIFNRLLWATPDGEIDFYDKRHRFALMGEEKSYSAGSTRKLFRLGEWRISPQICYDLRFPVWCRNRDDYDLLLFVANWPSARHYAWRTLIHARAIENQAYVVGVNRVGLDANNVEFGGGSLVVDPLGATLTEMNSSVGVTSLVLSAAHLQQTREKLPFLRDRDQFSLH